MKTTSVDLSFIVRGFAAALAAISILAAAGGFAQPLPFDSDVHASVIVDLLPRALGDVPSADN